MKITKEQIQNIVLEELETLLKEELEQEGILDLLKKKKSPSRSAEDEAALAALQTMSPSARSAAKDVKVTGYKDLASKETGKPMMKKSRSYSLEEEGDDYPAPSRMKKLVAQAKLDARYQPSDMDQLKKDYDKHVRSTLRDPKHADAHKRE
jgi:hypothetical protein